MMRIFLFIFLLLASFTNAMAENHPAPPGTDFNKVVNQMQQNGDRLLSQYNGKNGIAVMNGFSSMYFDHYEGEGMELAVMAISPTINSQTESLFTQLIGQAASNTPLDQMQKTWSILKLKLLDDADLLQSNAADSFSEVLFQAFIILLREGFEAMLVITALLAYLRRSNNTDKNPVIYFGVGLALIASAVTAYLFNTLFHAAGTNREAMEGITMLVASGVLFYVSYWLFSKREAERWQNYIRSKMDKALTNGSLLALGLAAFLAVYREGAETILFYQALAANAQQFHMAFILGIVGAISALFLLYWIMQKATLRIPYRIFFTATAFFLFYMAFYFIGGAMLELQEAGWLAITPITWLPPLAWLGIYPTWESIGAQLAFLAPSIGFLTWHFTKKPAVEKPIKPEKPIKLS
jgi:high-affinity iron transporter